MAVIMQVFCGMWLFFISFIIFGAIISHYDARNKFPSYADDARKRAGEMPPGCDCAQVVLGKIYPNECTLFGKACLPRNPIGPCMVSDEGACRIWWANGMRQAAPAADKKANG